MDDARKTGPGLAVVESLPCHQCGAVDAKPTGGVTVRANPGCPECGYVGWLAVAIPVSPELVRHRSVAGRPRRRSA